MLKTSGSLKPEMSGRPDTEELIHTYMDIT